MFRNFALVRAYLKKTFFLNHPVISWRRGYGYVHRWNGDRIWPLGLDGSYFGCAMGLFTKTNPCWRVVNKVLHPLHLYGATAKLRSSPTSALPVTGRLITRAALGSPAEHAALGGISPSANSWTRSRSEKGEAEIESSQRVLFKRFFLNKLKRS